MSSMSRLRHVALEIPDDYSSNETWSILAVLRKFPSVSRACAQYVVPVCAAQYVVPVCATQYVVPRDVDRHLYDAVLGPRE